MKILLSLCLLFMVSSPALAKSKLKLFTLEQKKGYNIEDTAEALDVLLDSNKDIIVFIHGRGKHPKKGIKLLPKIEKRYNSKVLMFNWKSWNGPFTRPLKSAKSAAPELAQFFKQINAFKAENPVRFSNINFTLLVHSMGNAVLKEYSQNNLVSSLSTDLFDNVILNSSDISAPDHAQWVNRIKMQKELFVVMNDSDNILNYSKKIITDGRSERTKLGLSVTNKSGEYYQLATNATYIDLSAKIGKSHRHYLMKKKYKTPLRIYKSLFKSGFLQYRNFDGFYPILFGQPGFEEDDRNFGVKYYKFQS